MSAQFEGFFSGRPCDVELVIRQSEKLAHQAFTEDVFFSLLVYIVHYSFLDDAVYKFTYLLSAYRRGKSCEAVTCCFHDSL